MFVCGGAGGGGVVVFGMGLSFAGVRFNNR